MVLLDRYITVGGAVLQAQLHGKLPEFLTQAGGGGRAGGEERGRSRRLQKEKGDCVYVLHCHLMLKCDLSCDTFSKSDLDCFLCS